MAQLLDTTVTGNITVTGTVDGVDLGSKATEWDAKLDAVPAEYLTQTEGDARYLQSFTETDPVFGASAAAGIVAGDITNWNTAFGWGDHALAGYLTEYTETDPVFSASAAAGIAAGDITNWNTAFGWGDHAGAGYAPSTQPTLDYPTVNNGYLEQEEYSTTATKTWSASGGSLKRWDLTVGSGSATISLSDQESITLYANVSSVSWTGVSQWVGGEAPTLDAGWNVFIFFKSGGNTVGVHGGLAS